MSGKSLLLLRRLIFLIFNPKPGKNFQSFVDDKDRKIWFCLHGDCIQYLTVIHKGKILGDCKFFIEDSVLTLGDIFISEQFPEYRNSGIGTTMFRLLVDYARDQKYSRIEGWMQPEHSYLWPKLIGFYQSLGCTIEGNQFYYTISQD
jgi:RimJ/RimL family protein N-acetyltransferase